jgi:hypothetical protein
LRINPANEVTGSPFDRAIANKPSWTSPTSTLPAATDANRQRFVRKGTPAAQNERSGDCAGEKHAACQARCGV